jgi:CRP-like cAMP-binding protein
LQKAQLTFRPHQNDPHKLLAQTGAGRATEDYPNDQHIFVQGEVAASVFFIQKGRVKITVTSEHGKDAVLGIMDKGQFFGEGCLQDQPLRTAAAIALGDCRITSITKAAMLSAIRDQPKFAKLFHGPFTEPKQSESINSLIRARSDLLACYCFSLTMGRKETRPSFQSFSVRRRLRK